MLRSDRDQRTCGSSVCVNESVGRNLDLIERVYDVARCVEATAVRVHVENDGESVVALGCFHGAPQERQQRRCDFTMERHHHDIALVDSGARRSRRSNGEHKSEADADGKHLHLSS